MANILVVDDDSCLRPLLVRLLEISGHHVVAAGSVAEGLAAWHESANLCLGVFDVQLPDGTGLEIAAQIRAVTPGFPVLYVSGAGGNLLDLELTHAEVRFLPKPFTGSEFSSAVEALLSQN